MQTIYKNFEFWDFEFVSCRRSIHLPVAPTCRRAELPDMLPPGRGGLSFLSICEAVPLCSAGVVSTIQLFHLASYYLGYIIQTGP